MASPVHDGGPAASQMALARRRHIGAVRRPVGSFGLLAGLVAVVVVFLWRLVFTNLILSRGDTFLYIYPYWTSAAEAIGSGRLPLWNPILFMGVPFLANSQVGLLYPLNWPFWLLAGIPTAASLSIALHLCLAAIFAFGFARDGLGLRSPSAWLAAMLYALGGYLTAQVEHVNQVQGLAWLPAVFWLLSDAGRRGADGAVRPWLLGAALGMQLLAGHVQASFVTVVGAGIYAGWLTLSARAAPRRNDCPAQPGMVTDARTRVLRSPIARLIFGGLLALLLAAMQILPTIELSRQSIRGGGLRVSEAVSFSLPPLLLGRSLLPGYGETLYSEYVAFLPLTALLLALIGFWSGRRRPAVVALALVSATGLLFALGAANPAYWLLVKVVPGFSLFRVPARWLALYAFGTAGLAACGLDALLAPRSLPRKRLLAAWICGMVLLAGWAQLAPRVTSAIPAPREAPVEAASSATVVMWLVEAAFVLLVVGLSAGPLRSRFSNVLILVCLLVNYGSSRALPYNHPAARASYDGLRPPAAILKAATIYDGTLPPDRFLSISNILFDPGDSVELQSLFSGRLNEEAFYDLVVATKQMEILAPNLPLTLGVPAVDGYDGGVLPLSNYVTLQRLLLPPGVQSPDGRLWENLRSVPDGRWLSLFNVRYLITDKVSDAWADGVFHDLQHQAVLDDRHPLVQVAYLPPYESTGLSLVSSYPAVPAGTLLGNVVVTFEGGTEEVLPLVVGAKNHTVLRTEADGAVLFVYRLNWAEPGIPTRIAVVRSRSLAVSSLTINGLALVDGRDGSFQTLVVSSRGRYRLIHSGDVKVYENLDVIPRAWLAGRATWVPDEEAALARMSSADFDPAAEVVLAGPPRDAEVAAGSPSGWVAVTDYQPERVELAVKVSNAAWLVLSDSYFPGWRATVDGSEVSIVRADILFRAVPIGAGAHRVVFSYRPSAVQLGALVSGVAMLLCLWGLGRSRFLTPINRSMASPTGSRSRRQPGSPPAPGPTHEGPPADRCPG